MSSKPLPFDSHALLAQRVRKKLADGGPMTWKELVRVLRADGSPALRASGVRKVLDQTMRHEVQRLEGNKYALIIEE